MELETAPSFFPSLQIYEGTSPEIVSTEEGTFNFWAQEVTEHRKSP